jgi:hypothetical protein
MVSQPLGLLVEAHPLLGSPRLRWRIRHSMTTFVLVTAKDAVAAVYIERHSLLIRFASAHIVSISE